MNMRVRQIKVILVVSFLISLVALNVTPIYADGVDLTLLPVSGVPGTIVTVEGIITNNSSNTVYLNSESFTLPLPLINGDNTDFFVNAPFSLSAGTNSGLIALFTFQIAPGTSSGIFPENFLDIIGGGASDFTDVLASSEFSAIVVTPEPGPLPLFGTAISLLAALAWRKKKPCEGPGENSAEFESANSEVR
jgi:hypothetical protein